MSMTQGKHTDHWTGSSLLQQCIVLLSLPLKGAKLAPPLWIHSLWFAGVVWVHRVLRCLLMLRPGLLPLGARVGFSSGAPTVASSLLLCSSQPNWVHAGRQAGRRTGHHSVHVECQPCDVVQGRWRWQAVLALALAWAFEQIQSFNNLNGDLLSWRPWADQHWSDPVKTLELGFLIPSV